MSHRRGGGPARRRRDTAAIRQPGHTSRSTSRQNTRSLTAEADAVICRVSAIREGFLYDNIKKTYIFSSWSDGGAQTHNITAPATNATYTARFR